MIKKAYGSSGGTVHPQPAGTDHVLSNQKVHLLGNSLLLKTVPQAQARLSGDHCPGPGPGAHCQ